MTLGRWQQDIVGISFVKKKIAIPIGSLSRVIRPEEFTSCLLPMEPQSLLPLRG